MSKLKLKGRDLRLIGYPEGPVISIAMNAIEKRFKRQDKPQAISTLEKILKDPADFIDDAHFGVIAQKLIPAPKDPNEVSLSDTGVSFSIFGNEFIEPGALNQMYQAAKLPVSVAGALMPDAHQGYGLPIGGVLAVKNAVIPYGVGVDIGCRMCLSIFDIDPSVLVQKQHQYTHDLNEATLFGGGKEFAHSISHDVMDRSEFYEIPILKGLQPRAAKQLGSSGSGNHFVEFGIVEIGKEDKTFGVPEGKYVGLLSHSGSRGLGAAIAAHFTRIAKEKRKLPGEAANLAWLNMDEEEGIEYWLSMNLAGDYASACHHIIHHKIAKQLGRQPIKMVENHHNFAWKEMHNGEEVIVHRKGATPAGKNVLGIIPGSMTAPGFIVKGRGEPTSLNSASHGAGRKLSRTSAINSITQDALDNELKKHGVTLLGGGLDEAPFAYKDINEVMQSQTALVDIVGTFKPKIVKMDSSVPKQWRKK